MDRIVIAGNEKVDILDQFNILYKQKVSAHRTLI